MASKLVEEIADSEVDPVWTGRVLVLCLVLTASVAYFTRTYWRLSHIPGPIFARLTNLPRLNWVRSYRAHDIHTSLHRRYGPIVRFGPNMISVADPDEIGNIYRFSKPWRKSDFYQALLMKPDGKPIPGIFAAQDDEIHKRLKRPVAGAYAMSSLVSFEPYVDSTMRVFCDQLRRRFVETGEPCDLGKWLQMFAFDVIGELTFSRRLGFLETGEDREGVMDGIWDMFRETSLVTQMPWIDDLWTNNPIRRWFRRGISPGAAFAMARVKERHEAMAEGKNDWDRETRDFLSRFLEVEANDPSTPPYAVAAWASSNITAGSDTTGIYLRAIFHYLLSTPSALSRLRDEIDAADLPDLAPWHSARELPYLDACIKEAGRLHGPFGLPYERDVPEGGATICGKFVPGGTVVGMSSWVVGRDRVLYGEDADAYRPERWLEPPGGEEQRKKMESCMLAFGSGNRTCMGKHIAYLEMYKVVPTLLSHFDFELLGPDEGAVWEVQNRWLTMQKGLVVRLKFRSDKGK